MKKRQILLNIDNAKRLMIKYKEIDFKYYLEVTTNTSSSFINILNNPTVEKNFDFNKNNEILLEGDYFLIYNYIKKNPELKRFKLIINKEFDLNTPLEELENLANIFKNINNIYIKGKHNFDYVTINEYIKTIKAINSIVDRINSYNLSPLEQILYVYDFVRQKEFKMENANESLSISRDISKILFNDKIVCAGYSNLFNAILEKLNINSNSYLYKNLKKKNETHVTNVVKIDDEKYNIHGVYYFDITKDRSKGNEDYLNSYLFFAKTKENFDDMFFGHFRDISLENYNLFRIKLLKIIKYLPRKDDYSLYLINSYLNIYDNNELVKLSKKESIDMLYKCYGMLNRPINHKKLIDALYKVRRIQFYEKGKKINFTKKALLEIAYNSDWINDNKKKK